MVKSEFGDSAMLWNQVNQLPAEQQAQVRLAYNGPFSYEVRLQLAGWLEEKFIQGGQLIAAYDPSNFESQQCAEQAAMRGCNNWKTKSSSCQMTRTRSPSKTSLRNHLSNLR